MGKFTDADFKEIPLTYLTTPRAGAIVGMNTFWIARNGNPVIYVRSGMHSRQCNSNRTVLDQLLPAYPDGYEVIFLPLFYEDHNCFDYV